MVAHVVLVFVLYALLSARRFALVQAGKAEALQFRETVAMADHRSCLSADGRRVRSAAAFARTQRLRLNRSGNAVLYAMRQPLTYPVAGRVAVALPPAEKIAQGGRHE
ncbi:hypothetical protein PYH37_002979 [Sinorhizobium numidicum]|uniref:Uncharacterized protein n=1 Tax=Sinorhizobium numidicum TaxID=680248 RepID=A0ABY8D1L0_9HYPH|nr:hypothetical protein [Sinorhizobium numidicum]WEX78124.1 hypothetical protein PYH37_002979 [Sinorhizobium numidicum]WEX84783.1 hypothetical protein PYH38_003692 [Sinorhizobium numidicum]